MPGSLRVQRIVFRAGRTPGSEPLVVQPSSIVVLIGPNSSGKSRTLRELYHLCTNLDDDSRIDHVILEGVEIDLPVDLETALELLRPFEAPPDPERLWPYPDRPGIQVARHRWNGGTGMHIQALTFAQLESDVVHQQVPSIKRYIVSLYTSLLNGKGRFSLVADVEPGDFLKSPTNLLTSMSVNDEARRQVQRLTFEAFGRYYIVDPTGMRTLRVRMSTEEPTGDIEQSLGPEGRRFQEQATPIREMGDGVQAFSGLISAVLALPHRIMLIDEPEAFLHPPLARRLGANLADISRQSDSMMFIATHSSEFLYGCIESGVETSIVRLSYENGVATARELVAARLNELVRDPLLRSTQVLRALFHKGAIVTEADGDRVFYDEINSRLLRAGRGCQDCLFLNAQAMGTIHRIVGPLREMGIPAAAIYDLDFIGGKSGNQNWDSILNACGVDADTKLHLDAERDHFREQFARAPALADSATRAVKFGIAMLSVDEQFRIESFLDQLGSFGVFLVPVGELEQWLPSQRGRGHGSDWVIDMFTKMVEAQQTDPVFIEMTGDVWSFLDRIAAWIDNPERTGVD